jgi:hypothetical protein
MRDLLARALDGRPLEPEPEEQERAGKASPHWQIN